VPVIKWQSRAVKRTLLAVSVRPRAAVPRWQVPGAAYRRSPGTAF